MRVSPDPRLPEVNSPTFRIQLIATLREIAKQLNLLSEGHIQAVTNASTAAPTTGSHQLGDYVRNLAPAELGGGGSKYWIRGWWCSVAGEPGTWLEDRGLTGN